MQFINDLQVKMYERKWKISSGKISMQHQKRSPQNKQTPFTFFQGFYCCFDQAFTHCLLLDCKF